MGACQIALVSGALAGGHSGGLSHHVRRNLHGLRGDHVDHSVPGTLTGHAPQADPQQLPVPSLARIFLGAPGYYRWSGRAHRDDEGARPAGLGATPECVPSLSAPRKLPLEGCLVATAL